MKTCTVCNEEKPLGEFHKRKAAKDGLQSQCKVCQQEASRRWEKENPEKNRERCRKWRGENLEKARERQRRWEKANPEKARERQRRWVQENPSKKAALNAKRRASKLQRTPSWADHEAIQVFYENAQWLSEVTGKPYHVDHIVPLQGERVSGLHIETNLRIVPAEENLRKGNKF